MPRTQATIPSPRRPLTGWRRAVVRAGAVSPINLFVLLAALALALAPTLSRLMQAPSWPPGTVVLGALLVIDGGTVRVLGGPGHEICSPSGAFQAGGGGQDAALERCGHCLLAATAGTPPAEVGAAYRRTPSGPFARVIDASGPEAAPPWRPGQPRAPPLAAFAALAISADLIA